MDCGKEIDVWRASKREEAKAIFSEWTNESSKHFFAPKIIFWEDQLSLGGCERELIRSGSIILLLYVNLSYW